MDMDHQLHQLLHFSAQEHFVMAATPPGFFGAVDGGDPTHFQAGGFVVDDNGGWVEDLMQLGDELFGGGGEAIIAAAGTGDDHVTWQRYDEDNGVSPDDDGPPPSVSLDDDGGSPPSGEQGSEPPAARKRRDRSKTIVSERKRRVRMKEKLYELRALVPNITKMDKASIIADAVVYVRDLQAHAMNLKDEVAALEERPRSPGSGQEQQQQHNRRPAAAAGRRRQGGRDEDNNNAGSAAAAASGARVTHVGAVQVGDGRFFVTIECERRDGVAAPLCPAVESLACFRVESSSLVVRSGPDRLVSTLTLKVKEQVGDAAVCEGSVVKLLVMAALLKVGFRHEAAAVGIS